MAGELSKEQSGKIADLAVSIQGDRARTWKNGVYGDFVESACMPRRHAERYAVESVRPSSAGAVARVAVSDSARGRHSCRRRRQRQPGWIEVGAVYADSFAAWRWRSSSIRPTRATAPPRRCSKTPGPAAQARRCKSCTSGHHKRQLLGERKIDVWWRTSKSAYGFSDKGPDLAKWKQTFSGTWTLVDADALTVEMINGSVLPR